MKEGITGQENIMKSVMTVRNAKTFLADPEIQGVFKLRHANTTSKLGACRGVHVAVRFPTEV
jgi:hypothetical protein